MVTGAHRRLRSGTVDQPSASREALRERIGLAQAPVIAEPPDDESVPPDELVFRGEHRIGDRR